MPQLLGSLQAQREVKLGRVLLLDNLSEDRPEDVAQLFPNLDISIVAYDETYKPGRMLNYGINFLQNQPQTGQDDKLLIISAHCFLLNIDALAKLESAIDCSEGAVRAVFGRQVPMRQSDDQAVRDLSLLYPNEDRQASKAASFNNAFSMIQYLALEAHLFDDDATNLEDVLWAAEEIDSGFSISYVSGSTVAHHHGPHHSNVPERLASTRLTIEQYKSVFHFNPASARVASTEILPVFITEGTNPQLLSLIDSWDIPPRLVVWTSRDSFSVESVKSGKEGGPLLSKSILQRSEKVPDAQVSSLYEALPHLQLQLAEHGLQSNYYLLFDDSFDPEYSFVTPELAASSLSENYQPAMWPVVETNGLIFTEVSKGIYHPNQVSQGGHQWKKTHSFNALRGNGLVLTAGAISRPTLAFSAFGFIELGKH